MTLENNQDKKADKKFHLPKGYKTKYYHSYGGLICAKDFREYLKFTEEEKENYYLEIERRIVRDGSIKTY